MTIELAVPEYASSGNEVGGAGGPRSPKEHMAAAATAARGGPGCSQRRRGVSFRDEYRAMKNVPNRNRAPSMVHSPEEFMIPPPADPSKITVVLDLDETLIYARNGPLYVRPHLDLLFNLLDQHFETVVWTAGVKAYAQSIITNIDKNKTIEHCVYRHKRWFSGKPGYQKDLRLLGRNMDNVIIIENTPDCIRGNPYNGILVADYAGGEESDPTIPNLVKFLATLIASKLTVPQFIKTTQLLTSKDVLTNLGDMYPMYTLPCSSAPTAKRINHDLVVDTNEDNVELDPRDAPLPAGAIRLNQPISPGGSYHNEWINNVAL